MNQMSVLVTISFCDLLTSLGVDEKTAMDDACRMEHAVSKKSFWPL